MRHRHINNRHTFGMLLNRQMMKTAHAAPSMPAVNGCVSVETAKRRHALVPGVPSSYWRLRHHHGYVMARPI